MFIKICLHKCALHWKKCVHCVNLWPQPKVKVTPWAYMSPSHIWYPQLYLINTYKHYFDFETTLQKCLSHGQAHVSVTSGVELGSHYELYEYITVLCVSFVTLQAWDGFWSKFVQNFSTLRQCAESKSWQWYTLNMTCMVTCVFAQKKITV